MPLTPTAERTGSYSVKYTWTGTSPFNVWQDGRRVLRDTTLTEYVAQTLDGTTNPLPAVEVRDATDSGTASSKKFSPLARFQWRGQADAVLYVIEEYVDSAWTARGTAVEDGSGYYDFQTTPLTDGATAQWRVVPQDTNGYQGEPLPLTHFMVRNPAPPAVSYSYDEGTGLLTVSAA